MTYLYWSLGGVACVISGALLRRVIYRILRSDSDTVANANDPELEADSVDGSTAHAVMVGERLRLALSALDALFDANERYPLTRAEFAAALGDDMLREIASARNTIADAVSRLQRHRP